MEKVIKIVKSNSRWHLEFEGNKYPIKESDFGIMDILKPSNNQTCLITHSPNDSSVCYFVKSNGVLEVFSYPNNALLIHSSVNIGFFKSLAEGVKYYLTPV